MVDFSTFLANYDLKYSVLLFFVAMATGIIGAMGGSGGLLLVPFMIASGVPPALALGTARFAAIGAWILASRKFSAAGQVRWKQLPIVTIIAVIFGLIGTYFIINIDEKYIYPIVGTILIFISPLAFLSKDFGLIARSKSKRSVVMGYLLYAVVMIYGGFFGAGAAILSLFTMVTFLGFRTLEAHATQLTAWVIMSFFSSAVFIYNGQVDYFYALIIFVSMALGSSIGSRFALKGGDKFIKIFVCFFAFIVGVKLLLWP